MQLICQFNIGLKYSMRNGVLARRFPLKTSIQSWKPLLDILDSDPPKMKAKVISKCTCIIAKKCSSLNCIRRGATDVNCGKLFI